MEYKYILTEIDGIIDSRLIPSDMIQYDEDDKEYFLLVRYGCGIFERPILRMGNEPQDLCDGFYIDIPGRAFNPLWVYKDFASCQKAATLLEENHVKGFIKTESGLIFVWNFSKKEATKQHE